MATACHDTSHDWSGVEPAFVAPLFAPAWLTRLVAAVSGDLPPAAASSLSKCLRAAVRSGADLGVVRLKFLGCLNRENLARVESLAIPDPTSRRLEARGRAIAGFRRVADLCEGGEPRESAAWSAAGPAAHVAAGSHLGEAMMYAARSAMYSCERDDCSASLAAKYATVSAAFAASDAHVGTPLRRALERLTGRRDRGREAAGLAAQSAARARHASELTRLLGEAMD
jgi:hypothetical protein